MSGLFEYDPDAGDDLTGVESRTLRALLHLERRHVAILAEMFGEREVTTERVTQWERSRGRGYPPGVVRCLVGILQAVGQLADDMRAGAEALGEDIGARIFRPRGPRRIVQLLKLPEMLGREFTAAELRVLDEGGGDFWQRLADAATCQAAVALDRTFSFDGGRPVRIVYDQDDPPGEAAR